VAHLRRIGVVLLVAAPLLAVRPFSRTLAAPFAARAAGRLGSLTSMVALPTGERRDSDQQLDTDPVPPAADSDRPAAPGQRRHQKKPHQLRVPRAAIVRAMARGANPTAQIVAHTDDHPGGIAILTAGSLKGILYPGDVITDVGGVPAASAQAVISVVARAQQAGAKVVSGRIWRRGEYFVATAETPWSCDGCTAENWLRPQ
jgi:S1-C subfamily serine protease